MSSPAETHAPLSDGWSVWRTFALRGAGLPISLLTQLAAPRCVESLDAWLEAQRACRDACAALLDVYTPLTTTAGDRKRWRKARRHLQEGRLPPQLHVPPEATASHDALAQARRAEVHASDCYQDYLERWKQESAAQHEALQHVAKAPLFRGAVLWQNRAAVKTGLEPLCALPPEQHNKRARQLRSLAARYLQRYAAKNDTIGFFGPVGWGQWGPGPDALVAPGEALLASQLVALEPWAVAQLAQAWRAKPALASQMPLQLHPWCWLQDGRLFGLPNTRSRDGSRVITAPQYAILQVCRNKPQPSASLAPRWAEWGCQSEPDAQEVIADLIAKGWLIQSIDVAYSSTPERWLSQAVAAFPSLEARATAAQSLQRLLDAKEALEAAAAGYLGGQGDAPPDSDALDQSLGALNRAFEAETGQAATRHQGQTYAGRTLAYHDCRRDLALELPEGWLSSLARPMSLVLQSARWFTFSVASAFRAHFVDCFDRLSARYGETISWMQLWRLARAPFLEAQPQPVADALATLQARWMRLLGVGENASAHRLPITSDELADAVAEAFAAPCPGWPGARHHAPDLMLAAAGPEALKQGQFTAVLGEIHPGLNPLSTLTMSSQHPALEALSRVYSSDLPSPGIAPIPDVAFARSAHDSRLARDDFHLDMGAPWASWRGPDKVLRAGDLLVRKNASGTSLDVHVRDRELCFDLTQLLERWLKMATAPHFSLLPTLDHTPRISIDQLVIVRESWRWSPDALPFFREKTPEERFAVAYRWGQQHELPQYLFASSPQEVKPIFVDRHSPQSIELLTQLARQSDGQPLRLTEMLPAPGQTWLPDAQGQTYTSELRLIAVDPVAWAPSLAGAYP